MTSFEIVSQTWRAEDGKGGSYTVAHDMRIGYIVAYHYPASMAEYARLGEYQTPAAAFSACMEHARLAANDQPAASADAAGCSGRPADDEGPLSPETRAFLARHRIECVGDSMALRVVS